MLTASPDELSWLVLLLAVALMWVGLFPIILRGEWQGASWLNQRLEMTNAQLCAFGIVALLSNLWLVSRVDFGPTNKVGLGVVLLDTVLVDAILTTLFSLLIAYAAGLSFGAAVEPRRAIDKSRFTRLLGAPGSTRRKLLLAIIVGPVAVGFIVLILLSIIAAYA